MEWYTQPKKSFSSFYFYDKDAKVLVRIRLELARSDKGDTKAIYSEKRYVGFSENEYGIENRNKLTVANGKVTDDDGVQLNDQPMEGFRTYDFSSDDGKKPNKLPHKGNKVTKNPKLPENISVEHLRELVKKCMTKKGDIFLTEYNDSERNLSNAIKKVIA